MTNVCILHVGNQHNDAPQMAAIANKVPKCMFLDENAWISTTISLKVVRRGPIGITLAMMWIMACTKLTGNLLSEPILG